MTNDEGMTKPEGAGDTGTRFWMDGEKPIIREEPAKKRVYDLEERTARFGEAEIDFVRTIPLDAVTNRIIGQLVGAATSVGANYVEADEAVSKKEFLKNIGTCRKQARETKHFLRMMVRALPEGKPRARILWAEARETTSDLFENPEERTMMFVIESPASPAAQAALRRPSSFLRHSSFVIRHFPHA